jgi:ubiquinone/menaquinone biosynthesis C-methylase UbiE
VKPFRIADCGIAECKAQDRIRNQQPQLEPFKMSSELISADFDRIALLSAGDWNHNCTYHDYLLRHLPTAGGEVLEIGCGAGQFSRRLARRSRQVIALDLSPQMLRQAREQSTEFPNIDYQLADVMTRSFEEEQFDCIASIATLHHLPTPELLRRAKRLLRAGGVLLVLDLVQPQGLFDMLANLVALPASVGIRFLRTGRLRSRRELRAAWDEHGRHDSYLTIDEVKKLCAEILPGAKIKKHLLWRYSLVWRKQ